MSWIEDQSRYDKTGEQPTWQSSNPHVPSEYRIDCEYCCFTNAKRLSLVNTNLRYVEGLCRIKNDKSKDSWGRHAWCVAPNGEIVDVYFEWKFPGQEMEYSFEPRLNRTVRS